MLSKSRPARLDAGTTLARGRTPQLHSGSLGGRQASEERVTGASVTTSRAAFRGALGSAAPAAPRPSPSSVEDF